MKKLILVICLFCCVLGGYYYYIGTTSTKEEVQYQSFGDEFNKATLTFRSEARKDQVSIKDWPNDKFHDILKTKKGAIGEKIKGFSIKGKLHGGSGDIIVLYSKDNKPIFEDNTFDNNLDRWRYETPESMIQVNDFSIALTGEAR